MDAKSATSTAPGSLDEAKPMGDSVKPWCVDGVMCVCQRRLYELFQEVSTRALNFCGCCVFFFVRLAQALG